MPRPKFQPTPDQRNTVKMMVGCGIPQDQICMVVINPQTNKPVSEQTLRTAFKTEISQGAVIANAKVAASLYEKACGKGLGAVTAAIWWTKCRMGWKETQKIEHSGPDGGAIQQDSVTKEQLAEAVKSVRDKF